MLWIKRKYFHKKIIYSFRKFHSIRKIQLNLIDIKIQFIFCNVILCRVFLDQGMNIIFQLYYNEFGMDNIFNLWWISFFSENIGIIYVKSKVLIGDFLFFEILGLRLFFNIWVYSHAKQRIPEFSGLQGKKFPGQ